MSLEIVVDPVEATVISAATAVESDNSGE